MDVEREASQDKDKETNKDACEQASMDADKQANMDADKQASMDADKQASLDADKQASMDADKQASMDADKQASMDADKQASMDAGKQASMDADKPTAKGQRTWGSGLGEAMGCRGTRPPVKVTAVSALAFTLHLVAEVLLVVAFSLPRWWRLTFTSGYYTDYGLWVKVVCRTEICEATPVPPIRAGKEFLFIATVFQCLAVALASLGVIAHALYLPIHHPTVRSVAMYCLAAAGLFALPSVFMLLGGLDALQGGGEATLSVGGALILSLVGGVLCLAGAIAIALASVQKARRLEDEVALTDG